MNLDFIAEIWATLRDHVDSSEKKDAAESLVNLLIDSGYDADDIKESFQGFKEISSALGFYREQAESVDEDTNTDDEDWDYDQDED